MNKHLTGTIDDACWIEKNISCPLADRRARGGSGECLEVQGINSVSIFIQENPCFWPPCVIMMINIVT